MKKHIYILLFTIGITFTSFAQNKINPDQGFAVAKIMKFYPNPATVAINFDFQRGYTNTHSLLIFNFMGKKVYEIKNTSPRMNINLEEFYRGIYIFQLRDKNGSIIESGKFQVNK
ncbi:MAG: T9SS type A sorting domain-containing protein [Ferruginibacter sp.]|nr:T9SS type A sorting domain-containing protein [Ferruginibacter sp.]